VREGIVMEVVCAHEKLQLLQLPHARQVAAEYLRARAIGVREVIAVLFLAKE
jgi:hypothetical protein